MSNKIEILLDQLSTPGAFIGDKKPGAGYHQKYDNLHTFVLSFNNWSGELRIQGTLDLFPGENSWVDLVDSTEQFLIYGNDSSDYDGTVTANVRGNFVWIRAVGTLTTGSIEQIQFSH